MKRLLTIILIILYAAALLLLVFLTMAPIFGLGVFWNGNETGYAWAIPAYFSFICPIVLVAMLCIGFYTLRHRILNSE